jgi:hypothetical protein
MPRHDSRQPETGGQLVLIARLDLDQAGGGRAVGRAGDDAPVLRKLLVGRPPIE